MRMLVCSCLQMTQKLKKIQNRYKKGHRLLESDVIDLLDQVCADNVFDE